VRLSKPVECISFWGTQESFSWPIKKHTAFDVTRRIIAVFTMSGYRSISWSGRIQSIKSSPLYLPQSYKLFAHLRLGLLHGVFHLGMNSLPHEEHFDVHLIFLHLIILIILAQSTNYEAPHHAVLSIALLFPRSFFILSLQTLNLLSFVTAGHK